MVQDNLRRRGGGAIFLASDGSRPDVMTPGRQLRPIDNLKVCIMRLRQERALLPHSVRSARVGFFRLKVADDPKEIGDRVRVPEVAGVLVALRLATVRQPTKVVDHVLKLLDAGHSLTISSPARSILQRSLML